MKRTKRFFAILLVLAMLLSQVQVVFAADPEVVPAEPSVTPSGEITLFTFTPSGNGQFTISSEDGYLTTAPAESGWGSVLACGETPTNWTVTVAANGTASVSTGSGWFNNYLVCNDGTFALNMWGGGNVALHDDDGEVFNKQPISAFEAYICNADSTKALCGDLSAVDYAAPEGVHKHNYEAVVTAPTCTVDGYSTYTCAECSKSFTADPTPAAHQKADGDEGAVTAPTCLEAGYVTFVCAVCGESFVEDGEPATGHSYEAAEVVPPTCTEDGYTNYVCSVCGAEKVDDPVKAKHTWAAGEVITAPTADAAGAKEYVCSVCGETVVVPVELNDAGEVVVKLGPTLLKDENSPTGYNAKFVYENADASEVTFAGDIGLRNDADPSDSKQYTPFEYKPGLMRSGSFTDAMAEVEDGVWFYEVPLAAGANQYWFYVDGDTNYMVPDPANAPNWSPNSPANKNAYNALYVPYDPVQDYEPMKAREAELPRASEDKGTWSYVPIEIDGFTHYAGVYLPYGYDAERAEPYKTIYILHGGGQDESDWMGIGSVQNILDNLIAEGRAEPAVLVSPTTNNNMMGGTGDAYANLFEALIPFVEENYNVSTDKMDRSLAGLSMGSMNTQNIINAVTEAEKFGYYGPWSGGASVQADAVGNEYAHMMFGGGHQDFGNPSVSFVDNLAAQGVYATYVGVTGAHDFNAWCQLFRIYVEEYLWNPAAFGDIGTLFTFTPTGTAGQYTIQTADGYLTTASAGWFGANLAFGANPANWTVTMAEDGTAALQTRAGWSNSYLVCNNDAFALNSRAAALKLYGDDGEAYTTLPTSAFEAYICIADGSKALRDDLSAADYVVPEGVHKHNYEAVKTNPTCTEGGYTTYTCADCGKSFTADAVAASHQRFANDAGVVTAPTCTEAGYVTYECAACGESFTEPGEPATGHSYDDGVVTAPTCTEDGYTTYTCTVCGDVKVSDTVKAGHSWVAGEVVAEPTETEAGAQAYACSACDAAKVVPVQLGEDGAVELKLGPTVTKDENSPTGYTVKFLYENADANTVTFAGDIALRNDVDRSDPKKYTPFEYAPGLMRSGSFTAPMDEIEDGVWYYEVPMAAGANQYWFYVNGNNNYMVPDPANHPQWSPNSNWNTKNAYNAVYVPYDPVQDYEPMAARVAELPRTDGQSGTWSYVPMEFGGRTHYAGIYLPYGYDAERAKPYKLIFTLHGSGQDESDWMGIGSVQHIMDNLVADGITEPAIIVSPTSNNSMVGGSGAGLNNLFNEVIPFLEENYNISSDPDDRAFVGLSMGAMNTMSLINAAADQFAYYAPLSGGMSVRADAPGLDKTHIFFATGWDDKTIRPNPTAYLPLKEAGFYVDYLEVTAGHDFNAWCQLFRIFLEDYAWQPAAFGDIGTEFTFTPTGNGQFTIQSGDGYLTTVSAGWSSSLAFGENPTAWNLAVAEDGTATISTGSGWFNNYLVCNNGTFALNMWGGGNVTLHDNDGEVYTKLPTSAFTAYICSADSTKVLRDNLSADDYSVAEDVHKHTYEAVVTAPTCTEDGYTTYTCAECGRSYTADPVAASHTKWANDAGLVTAPTCLEDGYISFQCAACGETFVEPGDPATGHNWSAGEVIAEPTETESGIQAYVCSGCDEVKEVPIQLNDAGEAEKKLGPTVIKDETSPTGYIAKFLYENKDANTVTFAGDIALRNDVDRTDPNKYTPFEYEPGMMRSGAFTDAMEEIEDGLWYYEVPLAAGANQYWFYVDGNTRYMVPDPANAPIWSPNSASNKNAYNAVYVPYDPVQDYEPMKAREAELPRTDGQSGTWSYVPIEFGGRTHYAGIYLPYGYDAEREEPYKLIFTLHGSGQDESDWMGIGSVQHIMDNLAAEGRTEPAIIVSPTSNNNMIGSAGDGYANLFNEILPFLEANYNISSDPEDRAFCGLSMGGGNTMSLINAAADQFAYYGPWSAGMSVRADAPGLDKTHVFFATGWDDTTIRPTPGAHQPLVDAGFHVDYLEVTAAHDFNAWCQLFRIFCEEYLWQPEAFSNFRTEDGLALGPNVIEDPESPTGYTVKFLYENDEAESVTFAGDIGLINWADRTDKAKYTPFEYKPGLMRSGSFTDEMTKREDGFWYYEVPLAAGANQYWFYIDGNTRRMVPDPANHPQWSPNSNWNTKNAYNAVYVPYNEKQDFEPLAAREAELPRATEKGTWSYVPIEIDGRTHYMGVYLPYGYDPEREEPYKTIWTLHGGGQDESDWMGIGSVQNIMDNLAAEGRTEPAIIVTPTTNNNMLGSTRDGYKNLFEVVIPFVEANYNVSTDPMDRALCGLSMGSMNTQNIMNVDASAFGFYGPWSGGNGARADLNVDGVNIFYGNGGSENDMTNSLKNKFGTSTIDYKYTQVAGAHDFNSWCQLFRIFLEDYLWDDAAFESMGPKVVKDPESPTGYTVEFRYRNDEATEVTFAGDIGLRNYADREDTKQYTPFEYVPDTDVDGDGIIDISMMRSGAFTAPMEKTEEGYWYYEVPLAAGANQYWFYVDGNTNYMVPDPANHPQWSPNSNWDTKNAYNAVYVPYDEKQGNELMAARVAELPRANQKGTWSYVPFQIGEATHYIGVYLPYGYDADREEPYKTIYMQHGGGQDESDWMGIGSVQNIMDNLAAEGRAEPAVIISPNSNSLGGSAWGGTYNNLYEIIIPFVEANYNVSSEPIDRAFAGLSMGSMITMGIINNDASNFGYYGPWSGGFSVRETAPGLDEAHIMVAGGRYDFGNPNAAQVQRLKDKGYYVDYVEVAGAHDFNAWCQLFRIFIEDYLWEPAAFGDPITADGLRPGPTVVEDPESPTGYTVKFLYKNDEATEVTFAGDIGLRNYADPTDETQYTPFDYVPDTDVDGDGVIDISMMRSGAFTAPMEKREDGYWYYEVPLAAGANQYWFYVDGNTNYMVPDPANHPQWSPNSNWETKNAYNAVYVPYAAKQGNELMAARVAELPRETEKGTWSYVPFQIGEATHYIGVYLPYGYDADREEPYKTIYMQHGGGQDESDWMGIGSVQNIMDNLAAEGRAEPAVIISPNSNSLGGSAWGGTYNNLYEIIIPFVEANYNVSTEAEDRAFAGLSMGSMIAQGIINNDASHFGYYGPWSGGFSVRETAPGLDDAHIMVAGGRYDFGNPNAAQVQALKDKGYFVDYVEVAGAHDFNAWCQLFRMFIEDYVWQPEAFGDTFEAAVDAAKAAKKAAEAAQAAAETAQAAAEAAKADAEAAKAAAEEAAASAAQDKEAAEAAKAAAEAAQTAAVEAQAKAEAAQAAAEAAQKAAEEANAEAAEEAQKAAEEASASAASAAASAASAAEAAKAAADAAASADEAEAAKAAAEAAKAAAEAAKAEAEAAKAAAEAAKADAEEAAASAAEDKAAAEAAKVAAEAAQAKSEAAQAAAEAAEAAAEAAQKAAEEANAKAAAEAQKAAEEAADSAASAAASAASAAEAAKAQAAAQAAQAKAEAAQKAAEEASASAAEDKAAAEAAKVAAEAAQKAAEEAKAAAAAAQAAAEEANAEAAAEAAKAAAEAAKSAASAAEAAKAQAAAQAAQAKAEDAQKAAEEAQAKADEAASRGEAAADEAEAAQKAADEAKAAAEDAKEAAALSAAAASESNAAAAEAAAQAAKDAAKVADAMKELAAIKAQVAADAADAKAAAEAAKAAELAAKKYLAQFELALALASLDISGYKPEQIADLGVNVDNALAAIEAAESVEDVDKALDAILEILGAEPVDNCPTKDFIDVPAQGNWAHEGIDYVVANGLMKGISDTEFDPNGTVTRAQLVTILYREAGEPEIEFKGVFDDVADGTWYSKAVEWAAAEGIVNGVGDNKFAPTDAITREQIATILYRYAGEPEVEGDLSAFPDNANVSKFAVKAMIWATSNGYINGVTSGDTVVLSPLSVASRAQIAAIIMRYVEG